MAVKEARSSATDLASVVILGDLHGHWDDEDERYYAALPCDLMLWTGDLADSPRKQYVVAESLTRCGPKAVGLLGNHDGASYLLASCEAHGYRRLEKCLSFGHAGRVRRLRSILGSHEISLSRRELPNLGLTLIGLCPLQSGGAKLAFASTLRRVYSVTDPEPLLRRLIDEADRSGCCSLGTTVQLVWARSRLPRSGATGVQREVTTATPSLRGSSSTQAERASRWCWRSPATCTTSAAAGPGSRCDSPGRFRS